jgi:hypothetical protein
MAAEPSPRHDVAPEGRNTTDCPAKLRVWTPRGHEKKLKMQCSSGDRADLDPGWEIGGGHAVGVTVTAANVFDATSGAILGAVSIEHPRIDKPEFAHEFWSMALSPDGNLLALVSRGPRLPPEGQPDSREDAMHISDRHGQVSCEMNPATSECLVEYLLAIYTLGGTPKAVYQVPLEEHRGGDAPAVLAMSGAMAFDHAAKRILVGTTDGTVAIASTTSADGMNYEHAHHASITRIVVSPGDGWVFSEDSAGEQRIWKMPRDQHSISVP